MYEVERTYLIGVCKSMSIDAIVTCIQLTAEKPGSIAVLESSIGNGIEITIPSEQFMGELGEELVRVFDRFFVKLVVMVQGVKMWLRGVLTVFQLMNGSF